MFKTRVGRNRVEGNEVGDENQIMEGFVAFVKLWAFALRDRRNH